MPDYEPVLVRNVGTEGSRSLNVYRSRGGYRAAEKALKEMSPDGAYRLATEECLAGCDYGPCMLINEKLHKRVLAADVAKNLSDAGKDTLDTPRSTLFDAPEERLDEETVGATSDVAEMKESS